MNGREKEKTHELVINDDNKIWLVRFNGISTSIGYLMPKPIYTYVLFVNT